MNTHEVEQAMHPTHICTMVPVTVILTLTPTLTLLILLNHVNAHHNP